MEKLSINFLGEKIKVDFPNDLSDLYQKIMNNFFLSEKDVKELFITYTQDPDELLIEDEKDFKLFIEAKVDIIDIDINQSSELYKNSFIKVQKENKDIKKKYDEILNKVNDIDKTKKEKKEKANNEIEIINKKIKDLEIKKKELIQKIDKEIKSHQNEIKLIQTNTQKEIETLEKEKKKLFTKADNIGVKLGLKSKIKQNKKKENKKEENKIKNESKIIPIINQIKEIYEEYNENEYQCDICKIIPIKGKRFHCQTCEDFDLCENCYTSNEKLKHYNGNHTFIIYKKKSN